jgi:hypothetical protein
MNKKEPINLYRRLLIYGIEHGLSEDEIDTHFLLSKLSQLKRRQEKTNSQSVRCTRCLKRNR